MNSKWQNKKIGIDDLILWDENVRFDEGLSGAKNKEITNFLFKNGYKMMELVEFFTEQGEIPQDEKILVVSENNKYKVIDGNRRVSVMNALNNPQILEKEVDRERVRKLKESSNRKESYRSIEALVAPNEVEARKIINRRHYNTGFLAHGAIEKDRGLYKEGKLSNSDAFALQYFEKILRCINKDDGEKLRSGYSTIKRLFAMTSPDNIKKMLHVVFVNGEFKQVSGKTTAYKEARDKVIYQILKKELNTRTINTTTEAEQYLNNILPKVEIPPNEALNIINLPQKNTKKKERFGEIKFFNENNGCEKIRDLYTQVSKLRESNNVVINICIGHLLECSIKELLKNGAVNAEEREYLDKMFTRAEDYIQSSDKEFKKKFQNTPYNIKELKDMKFHTMWNKLRHNPRKTATSFDTKRIRNLALEIVREIDHFLYENTT